MACLVLSTRLADKGLFKTKFLALWPYKNQLKQGLKLKKILSSPFGDQLEKYRRQMQIFSRQFV